MELFKLTEVLGTTIPKIVVFDVGARIEEAPRYQVLLEQNLARVVGFEPQPQEYERLLRSSDDAHTYYPYCLGKGGRQRFHVTRHPGCSSLYEPDPSVIDLFSTIGAGTPAGNFFVQQTTDVETVRLDSLEELPQPDYLKLDVQGAELDVLQGGERTISTALVLEAEVLFLPLYKHQPLFGDVQAFLSTRGFFLHKLIDVAGRGFAPLKPAHKPYAPFSQLLWADAVFVRDFSKLERFSDDDLVKASVVLHEVYRSIDIVAYFLAELDRRHGGDLRAAYMAQIQKCPKLPIRFLNIKDGP